MLLLEEKIENFHQGCFHIRRDCFVLGHKSSPHPSTLLVSFPNNAVPCLGKLACVVHSPIQKVAICTQLVCELPIHKKKKSTATLVYVHCSPVSLQWCRTSMLSGVLFVSMHVVFNCRDANSGHLAGFPTSATTMCSHVLV